MMVSTSTEVWTILEVWTASALHRLWQNVVRIFPEVVDVGVGVGYDSRGLGDAEVLGEDGVYEGRDDGVAGIGGVLEAILAITIRVIEQLAFRGTAEAVGLFHSLEPDDLNALHHNAAGVEVAGEDDVHGFVGAVLGDVGSDVAPFPGQRDALEVVSHCAADDGGKACIGTGLANDGVLVGNHRLWSLPGTTPSTSFIISWVTAGISHSTVSSVSSSLQSQNSNLS